MKKVFISCLVLVLVIITSSLAMGNNLIELINVHRNKVILEVNTIRVTTDNFLYNGTTYVPIRAVSELLGKDVGWNAYTNVASINEFKYEKEQLSRLLPDKAGYNWIYEGFAEYGHQMELDVITDEPQKRMYSISGEVGDPSNGESTKDRSISIKYTIEVNRLIQEKTEQAMLDSKYDKLILIKTPLTVGTFWTETVVDKTGKETLMNAHIKKVELTDDNKKKYTVKYEDTNSGYYEERVIKEGAGVVAFEKLLELEDSSFPVSYFTYLSGDLKTIQLNLYFADNNAEYVHLEKRDVLVADAQTAKAVVEALINGPVVSGLNPTIPEGTSLLNIYIQYGTCFVDFSREFIVNHPGGSAGELMTLASIVNSLTELDTIDRVQILVEGKSGETLGQILLAQPFERMADLIE
ncbi:MAG: GerMN domain-containing protein [Desulfotomaculaceae bacterium]